MLGFEKPNKFDSDETGMQSVCSGSFGRTNVGVKGLGTKMRFGKKQSQSSSINLVSAMNRMGFEKPKTAYSSGLPRQNVGDKKQKVPKMAEARLLFPIVSCLGGYWLCIGCILVVLCC